ncbi:hypothetical protein [Streptomyces sp. NBC_00286]|uniref:hypothetical protein n=1 Tax=Streptomyces sp. NBC_00286 TaxID=2975701 RepID=UPI002E2B5367|nr:hypothetical protein [Streptomyces sp. NBC_00286]
MPTTAQTRMVAGLRDDLIDACMKDAGFGQWTPAPGLPSIGGKTLTDWRYGIHDATLAAKVCREAPCQPTAADLLACTQTALNLRTHPRHRWCQN